MALIKCNECGKEIEENTKCPYCGCVNKNPKEIIGYANKILLKALVPILIIMAILFFISPNSRGIGYSIFLYLFFTPIVLFFVWLMALLTKGKASNVFFKYIGIGAIICVPIFLICYFGANGSSPSDEEMNSCRNNSNTYQKCSWSVRENRCVCKFR